jgi:hypothetical protein
MNWSTVQQTADTGASVDSASCISTSLCVAVDQSGKAVVSTSPGTASSWSTVSTGAAKLLGVSCTNAAATNFCVAVGATGTVATSTNPAASWSHFTLPGSTTLTGVTCTTTGSFCIAWDTGYNVFTSTNPTVSSSWSELNLQNTEFPYTIDSVSCVQTTSLFCAAVGSDGNVLVSTNPTVSWTDQGLKAFPYNLNAVSCTSSSFCIAGDSGGNVWSYNGTGWTEEASVAGNVDPITGMSCTATNFCAAVSTQNGEVITSTTPTTGSSWVVSYTEPTPPGSLHLAGMSCVAQSICISVDVNTSFIIVGAPQSLPTLTITASSGSMTYGGTVPNVTPSYSPQSAASTLTSQPTCTTTATSSSPAGTYPTSCSGAQDASYKIVYVAGATSVNTAPLTITASSASATYGASTPTITATYSGFVNGDSAASLMTKPTCSTTATSSSPVGAYPTSCSGAADSNYNIAYTGGTITVGTAQLVITASSSAITYGGSAPVITPSYSGFVNGDSASSLATQPSCSSSVTSSTPAGGYQSSCSGAADANYTISYVPGTVQVGRATLTITASSETTTYGAAVPSITASYAGFVNGDTPASLSTAPTCKTNASSSSAAGSYGSSCSGAIDPNYTINYADGTVTIGTAVLTITASSGSSIYGSDPDAVTASYSGFVNGDGPTSLSTPPSCSSAATAQSAVGTYPTSCSGAVDGNYTISYVGGSDDITPAPLVVSASSTPMTYGGAVPSIGASFSGFVNGDTEQSLTTAPSCTTEAQSSSPVGTYPSSCSGAVDTNYDITYSSGSVVVGSAPLTVTASSGSMTYGGSPPVVSPSYTGFVNGDSLASLGTALSCTTAASSSSPVGGYASSCSGGVDANYTITYAQGSITILPAPLTIDASSGSMTYGGTPPTITASYTGLVNGDQSPATIPVCGTSATSASHVDDYPSSCSGADDPNYAISYEPGTVTVGPAALVVTASSGTMTYGGAVPTVTASYSGFVNDDSPTSLTTQPVCGTDATSSSAVGTYTTSCQGTTDPDYAITYIGGTINVDPATLVVTASSGSMTYGGTAPAIAASYSGFVNGDTASDLQDQPSCGTDASSSSPVGTYTTSCDPTSPILSQTVCASSCTGAVDANYSVQYVDGSVSISTATLVITASSPSISYGNSAPAVTPTYNGFVNGDSENSTGFTPPTCTSTAPAAPAIPSAGSYTTSCSGASDNNYSISYVDGKLVAGTDALVITASSSTMTFGGSVPTVSASLTGLAAGDSQASLGGGFSCSTTATSTSPPGSYPTTCSGASDGNYSISYVSGSVTVTPAPLTITASSGTMSYGGTVPTITASYNGFVNGEGPSALRGTVSCKTAATTSSNVATYSSSCSGASDPNYAITYVAGTVTVLQVPLTITASTGTMTYGGSVPTITASYNGFVNGDSASSLTVGPSCSTTATSSSSVGNYPSSCNNATDGNYLISYQPGSVVVQAAPLVITAANQAMTYGTTIPTISSTYNSFVNGDSVGALTNKPVCTTTATSNSAPGTYSTTCSGAVDPNYSITYAVGTLTVLPVYLASGDFVIGNVTAGQLAAGTAVQFWGSQWAKANQLSAGAAPSSFKGFEDAPQVSSCGVSWTTDPGNSTPPPATVSPYTVMVVSSAVTQSGSVISGNTPHLVIVKTNPGYAADPGHAGTGTIYKTLC